jgi:hypothetical protein
VGVLALPGRVSGPAWLATVVSGVALSATAWGHPAWIVAAMVAIVPMGAAGGAVTGRTMRRLGAALAADVGAPGLPAPARALLDAPSLPASLRLRIALGVGVVALMTMKPGGVGSAFVLATSAAAGVAAAVGRDGATLRQGLGTSHEHCGPTQRHALNTISAGER